MTQEEFWPIMVDKLSPSQLGLKIAMANMPRKGTKRLRVTIDHTLYDRLQDARKVSQKAVDEAVRVEIESALEEVLKKVSPTQKDVVKGF